MNAKILTIILFFEIIRTISSQSKYYFSNLNFKFTYNKTYPSNFSDLIKYDVNRLNTYELYPNKTLVFTDLQKASYHQKTYFNSANLNSRYSSEVLIDYSLDEWKHWQVHFLVESSEIITCFPSYDSQYDRLHITDFSIYRSSILKSTNQSFYVINVGDEQNGAVINRILRQQNLNMTKVEEIAQMYNFSIYDAEQQNNTDQKSNITEGLNATNATWFDILNNETLTTVAGGQIRATVCKKTFQTLQYIALWNSSSYMEIYECDYFSCTLEGTISNDFGNGSWIAESISFGYDCNKLFMEFDDLQNPTVYNRDGSIHASYPILQQVIDFKPLGGSSYEANILFPNGSFIIFSLLNETFMKQYRNFGIPTSSSQFHRGARSLIINYQDHINVYRLECWNMVYYEWWRGECYNCSNTCLDCHQWDGYCVTCIPDHKVSPHYPLQCIPIIHPNVTNITIINTTIPATIVPNATIDMTFNNTSQTNNTNSTTEQYQYGAVYFYQLKTAEGLLGGFYIIGQILGVVLKALEILPLAWLFLNFMNFWNICSFYVFLKADIPEYLHLMLKIIYDKINTPIFGLENKASKIYPLKQNLKEMNVEFGVSSSFLINNFQTLLIFTVTALTIGLIVLAIQRLPKQGWIYKKFTKYIKFQDIIICQFISSASNYFLPFSLILKKFNQSAWNQIFNSVLHFTFIGFSLLFPFLIFSKVAASITKIKTEKLKTHKNILHVQRSKKNQIQETIEWTYQGCCNTIIPFLCVLEQPHLYYFVGILFFVFGVWIAYQKNNSKLNDIILALHRLLFHLSFSFVVIFGQYSVAMKHNAAMICGLILFIGAVHQLLTLFFQVGYFIFKQIYKFWLKPNKIQDIPNNETQINSNTNQLMEKSNKMTIRFQKIDQLESKTKKVNLIKRRLYNPIKFKTNKVTIIQQLQSQVNSINEDQNILNLIQHKRTKFQRKSVEKIKTCAGEGVNGQVKDRIKLKMKSYVQHKIKTQKSTTLKDPMKVFEIEPDNFQIENFE